MNASPASVVIEYGAVATMTHGAALRGRWVAQASWVRQGMRKAPMVCAARDAAQSPAMDAPLPREALLTALSDEEAMLAYGAGDATAFATLYDRHERAVHRFILRALGAGASADVADDLLQDTWFAVARQAASYRPTAKFTTWLYTIARSRVIDHLRAKKAHVSLDETKSDDETSLKDLIADDERNEPLRQVESRQQARAFLSAVQDLPEEQRLAFLLQAESDMTVEEIAEVTSAGLETVKSRLRYARAKLRSALEEWK
jgi:RNA polymerase sigma-70 factor (ECF subfamily)